MRKRLWLRLVLLAMAVLLAASWGVSGALEVGWARRSLLARLAASLGRPVEVGRFEFSLLSGPKLEADSVSVAEDPRFGREYFLRAAQLTAVLRWTGLLRGRIEFGSLSLTRPSLNLVRNADGHWNIESWLPAPNDAAATQGIAPGMAARASQAAASLARRLDYIEVDGGRINFKRVADKLSFALVDVNGRLDQDSAGRWSLDLTADPMRTSVALQEAGTLRLQGTVAGTSARLRPANLTLTWEQASLADAMRLASGQDYGLRGALDAEFTAKTEDESRSQTEDQPSIRTAGEPGGVFWRLAGTLHFADVHRWDLPGHPSDPAVNVSFTAAWQPGRPRLEISRYVVASPHSHLDAVGALDWSAGFHPRAQLVSSRIAFGDVLGWSRVFQPAIADDLAIDGAVGVTAMIADWPPHVEQAELTSEGAVVHAGALGAIQVGRIKAKIDRSSLILAPMVLSLPGAPAVPPVRGSRSSETVAASPPSAGTVQVEGALGPFHSGQWPRDWGYRVGLSGDTQRAQDLLAVVSAFGRPVNIGGPSAEGNWSIDGPATLHLVWTGMLHHGTTSTNGTLELHGLRLNSPLMNQPVVVSANIEVHKGGRTVKITSAAAFGAEWKGSLDRSAAGGEWNFDLLADRLDAAELDRWLVPRARPGLFERMLPFASQGGDEAPERARAIEALAAHGRLRVGEVALAPLHIEKLDASAEIHGRHLVLRSAQAVFYSGRMTGDFAATLLADPSYSFYARIERTNLATLAVAGGSPAGRVGGLVSGELRLAAHGIGRQNLLGSLEGDGELRIRDAMLSGFKLDRLGAVPESPVAEDAQSANEQGMQERFGTATASVHLAAGRIRVDQLSLVGRDRRFQARGAVDFARRLDLLVWSVPRSGDAPSDSEADSTRGEWVVGGTLDDPQWSRQADTAGNDAVAKPPARR